MIDRDAEAAAIDGWRAGDRAAGARLVAMHEGTIFAIVRRYLCARVDLDDLIQVGRLALLKAAASPTFDPAIANFTTYAGLAIARKAVAYRRRASADLSASDTSHNILADIQQDKPGAGAKSDMAALTRLRQHAVRLDAPAYDDGENCLLDTLAGSHKPVDELLAAHREHALAVELVAGLDDQAREIIRRRYLCDEQEQQDAIAASLGCTGSFISQIEIAALALLRKRAAWITRTRPTTREIPCPTS